MKVTLSFNRPDLLNKHNVSISNFTISAAKLRNKIIMVMVDWINNSELHSFKYVSEGAHGFGYEYGHYHCSVSFTFNNSIRYRLGNDRYALGFGLNLEDDSELKYTYQYFENTKYGIVAYFFPEGFINTNGIKEIKSEIVP